MDFVKWLFNPILFDFVRNGLLALAAVVVLIIFITIWLTVIAVRKNKGGNGVAQSSAEVHGHMPCADRDSGNGGSTAARPQNKE